MITSNQFINVFNFTRILNAYLSIKFRKYNLQINHFELIQLRFLLILLMKVEEDTHSDANLEAMFGLFRLQEPQDMVCDNSKDIKRMCINPECEEVSLTCNDLDCEKCHNRTHNQCPCVQLLGVT